MDFTFTDSLFQGDNKGYIEFLNISLREFETDFPKLVTAIKNGDVAAFRAVHHKFSTRLNTFKLAALEVVLMQMKSQYISAPKQANAEENLVRIQPHIDGIYDAFRRKIASVS